MIDAMGGASSPHYQRFRSFCFVAFSILRKSSNLLLNLFSLMVGSNIPDIAAEPDKAVMKVTCFLRNILVAREVLYALVGGGSHQVFPGVDQ